MPTPDTATPTDGVRTAPTPDLIHDLTLRSIAHNVNRQKPKDDTEATGFARRLAIAIGTPPNDADETAKRAVALYHQMYDEREHEKPLTSHVEHYQNAIAVLTYEGDVQLAQLYMLMALYEALIVPGFGETIGEYADRLRKG